MAKPILYTSRESSCSWRVRTALALKNVDFEHRAINLSSQGGTEQFGEKFTKVNPLSQVPALVVGDQVIVESLAIVEYIDEVYDSGVRLLPKDPILRAKARAVGHTIASGIQPLQNDSVERKVEQIQSDSSGSICWAKSWISSKFEGLEKLLSETSGKCCVGDDITIADLCLVPQVYNALHFGVDMKPFPIISRINEYLLTVDAFSCGHPSEQPDCRPQ